MHIPYVAHTCISDTAGPPSSAEVRASKWGHLFDIRASTFYALTAAPASIDSALRLPDTPLSRAPAPAVEISRDTLTTSPQFRAGPIVPDAPGAPCFAARTFLLPFFVREI
ncbi:hypothetical protein KM043_015610 [Ampulex compressa]|nr:hypothetical protein KM043_015610 [Ampulex compressa]